MERINLKNKVPAAMRSQIKFECNQVSKEWLKYYSKRWFKKVTIDNLRILEDYSDSDHYILISPN